MIVLPNRSTFRRFFYSFTARDGRSCQQAGILLNIARLGSHGRPFGYLNRRPHLESVEAQEVRLLSDYRRISKCGCVVLPLLELPALAVATVRVLPDDLVPLTSLAHVDPCVVVRLATTFGDEDEVEAEAVLPVVGARLDTDHHDHGITTSTALDVLDRVERDALLDLEQSPETIGQQRDLLANTSLLLTVDLVRVGLEGPTQGSRVAQHQVELFEAVRHRGDPPTRSLAGARGVDTEDELGARRMRCEHLSRLGAVDAAVRIEVAPTPVDPQEAPEEVGALFEIGLNVPIRSRVVPSLVEQRSQDDPRGHEHRLLCPRTVILTV